MICVQNHAFKPSKLNKYTLIHTDTHIYTHPYTLYLLIISYSYKINAVSYIKVFRNIPPHEEKPSDVAR